MAETLLLTDGLQGSGGSGASPPPRYVRSRRVTAARPSRSAAPPASAATSAHGNPRSPVGAAGAVNGVGAGAGPVGTDPRRRRRVGRRLVSTLPASSGRHLAPVRVPEHRVLLRRVPELGVRRGHRPRARLRRDEVERDRAGLAAGMRPPARGDRASARYGAGSAASRSPRVYDAQSSGARNGSMPAVAELGAPAMPPAAGTTTPPSRPVAPSRYMSARTNHPADGTRAADPEGLVGPAKLVVRRRSGRRRGGGRGSPHMRRQPSSDASSRRRAAAVLRCRRWRPTPLRSLPSRRPSPALSDASASAIIREPLHPSSFVSLRSHIGAGTAQTHAQRTGKPR